MPVQVDVGPLTTEQQDIARSPAQRRLLVVAGPGAGKTHTLVARILTLVETEDLQGAEDIVSLSFSRSAVRELRTRTRALRGDASRVLTTTFDSYASRLLQLYSEGDAWRSRTYDDRIRAATSVVVGGRADDDLAGLRHLFVDEAQDLVEERAEFVMALLSRAGGGVTVFGDPAQAIYDFGFGGSENPPSFFDRLRVGLSPPLEEVILSGNHRTAATNLLKISDLGELLRARSPDRTAVIDSLRAALGSCRTVGSIATVAPMLRGASGTAILTRDNGQALVLSMALHEKRVSHAFRRRADDVVIPGWIAEVCSASSRGRLEKDVACERASRLGLGQETTWELLRRLGGGRAGDVDVGQLADRVLRGLLPLEVFDTDDAPIVVSTIHRAKGLEFPKILIVPFNIDQATWRIEARILFVGLTRAAEELLLLDAPDTRGMRKVGGDRWVRSRFHSGTISAIEVRGTDVVTFDPHGMHEPPGPSSEELASYLETTVRPGDQVSLRRAGSDRDPEYHFDVLHEGRCVAKTNAQFDDTLGRLLGRRKRLSAIDGLHVEGLATVAVPTEIMRRWGLPRRLLPACRVQGMGELRFDDKYNGG